MDKFTNLTTEKLSTVLIENFEEITKEFFQLSKPNINIMDYKKHIIENCIYNLEETGDENYSFVIDYILEIDNSIELRYFIKYVYDKINKEHNINLIRINIDTHIGKKIFELYTEKYNLAVLFNSNNELKDKFNLACEKKYFEKINNVVNTFDNFKLIINSDDIFSDKYNDFYNQIEQILQMIKELN